jgi:hypothetical protein
LSGQQVSHNSAGLVYGEKKGRRVGSVICVTATAKWIKHGHTFTKEQTMSSLNTEPKLSKYELNEEQLEKATGGSPVKFEYTKQKPDGTAAGNVAAKWSLAQGAVA